MATVNLIPINNDEQQQVNLVPIASTRTPQQDVIAKMGKTEKFLVGVGAGMYDLYKGIEQLGAEGLSKIGIVSPETVNRVTQEGTEARADFAPLADQSTAAQIGNFVGKTAPMAVIPGGVSGGVLKRMGTSALAGAGMGAASFVPENESRLANVATGAVGGAAGSAILSGAGKLANVALSKPASKLVNQQLGDKYKIPLTLSEAKGTAGRVDTIMERVPWVFGIGKFRATQQQAAKEAATSQFSKYVIDPTLDNTASMKIANDAHLDTLYQQVKGSAATIPLGQAPEVKKAAGELLNRYPDVFTSIQDNKVKRILSDIVGDTATKTVDTGVLNAQGAKITKQIEPKFSFDDLWELRKGIGQAIGGAKTPTEKAQFSAIYSAVSDDMDTMMSKGAGGAVNAFKEANNAFKQYSVKFDAMREAYDKAIGTTGAGTMGFFSPQKYGTALKNLANDPKYKKNIKWTPEEIREMTGLANILQVTKRAGQFMENPPTGNRWGAILSGAGVGGVAYTTGGVAATVKTAGIGLSAALITKFLTTTPAGKQLILASAKIEPTSPAMQRVMKTIYNQLPKFIAGLGLSTKNNYGMSNTENAVLTTE